MKAYLAASQARPSTVQFATGAVVMAVGDAFTQAAVERRQTPDVKRNATAAVFNGGVSPVLYWWYGLLDRTWPGSTLRMLAPKLLCNQIISSTTLSPAFVVWSAYVEAMLAGELSDAPGREQVATALSARLQTEFARIVGSSFCVWLPANAINFVFVPPHLRIAFMSTVACGWGGFLSYIAHRELDEKG